MAPSSSDEVGSTLLPVWNGCQPVSRRGTLKIVHSSRFGRRRVGDATLRQAPLVFSMFEAVFAVRESGSLLDKKISLR
jgi:hypothetical protein